MGLWKLNRLIHWASTAQAFHHWEELHLLELCRINGGGEVSFLHRGSRSSKMGSNLCLIIFPLSFPPSALQQSTLQFHWYGAELKTKELNWLYGLANNIRKQSSQWPRSPPDPGVGYSLSKTAGQICGKFWGSTSLQGQTIKTGPPHLWSLIAADSPDLIK